ncbi:unnamed protein product [Caenorhabditis angaria]|uniref:Uncharacterized protein n=1 Tax=Caenorhabditis angaria TaxID=860376 RepID=A0A9P1IU01_9PELO|nr:unnamed protein product [Caenorhabditis angaria]
MAERNGFYMSLEDSLENRPGILQKIGKFILSSGQISKNRIPCFMIILIYLQIFFYFCHIFSFKSGDVLPIYMNTENESFPDFLKCFTYPLLNLNILELLCNLVIEIIIGIPLEIAHGTLPVFLVYLFSAAYFAFTAFFMSDFMEVFAADEFCVVLELEHNFKKPFERTSFVIFFSSLFYIFMNTVFVVKNIPFVDQITQHIQYFSSIFVGISIGFYYFYGQIKTVKSRIYFVFAVLLQILLLCFGRFIPHNSHFSKIYPFIFNAIQ